MIATTLLKIVYYVAFPAVFFVGIWLIRNRRKEIKSIKYLRRSDKIKKDEYVKKVKSRIKKYEALFLISLLLFSVGWSLISSTYCDHAMHSQMYGGKGSPKGPAYSNVDPVQYSLGPSYDTDEIINKMEKEPGIYLPEEVKEKVDLDRLTSMPGRLAVYRLTNYRYVLTYTYTAPYPVIKAYGFLIYEEKVDSPSGNDSAVQERLLLMKEQTIIYPEDPNLANDFIMG